MQRRRWAAGCFLIAIGLTGCGPRLNPVKGVVTLDGTPVEGAVVSFISEDRKQAYNGRSDANGNFELFTDEKPGAPAGTYKVVVTKVKPVPGGDQMTPGGGDYGKQMQKEAAEGKGGSKGPAMTPGMPMMKGGMPGMPGMPMMKAGASGPKTELPPAYASADSTPITVKVPLDHSPVTIELKSKP